MPAAHIRALGIVDPLRGSCCCVLVGMITMGSPVARLLAHRLIYSRRTNTTRLRQRKKLFFLTSNTLYCFRRVVANARLKLAVWHASLKIKTASVL